VTARGGALVQRDDAETFCAQRGACGKAAVAAADDDDVAA
jgi:hypothetical protein